MVLPWRSLRTILACVWCSHKQKFENKNPALGSDNCGFEWEHLWLKINSNNVIVCLANLRAPIGLGLKNRCVWRVVQPVWGSQPVKWSSGCLDVVSVFVALDFNMCVLECTQAQYVGQLLIQGRDCKDVNENGRSWWREDLFICLGMTIPALRLYSYHNYVHCSPADPVHTLDPVDYQAVSTAKINRLVASFFAADITILQARLNGGMISAGIVPWGRDRPLPCSPPGAFPVYLVHTGGTKSARWVPLLYSHARQY